jgi:hypothetical protein
MILNQQLGNSSVARQAERGGAAATRQRRPTCCTPASPCSGCRSEADEALAVDKNNAVGFLQAAFNVCVGAQNQALLEQIIALAKDSAAPYLITAQCPHGRALWK